MNPVPIDTRMVISGGTHNDYLYANAGRTSIPSTIEEVSTIRTILRRRLQSRLAQRECTSRIFLMLSSLALPVADCSQSDEGEEDAKKRRGWRVRRS